MNIDIQNYSLRQFEGELVDVLGRIKAGERTYQPSEDACRFCRGKAVCRARATQNLQVAIDEMKLAAPPTLSLGEIAELLPKMAQIAAWTHAVEEYALDQAIGGHDVPGYKLVEGRSNRVWKDTDQAAQALIASGVPDEQLWNKKLIGLTAAEKLLGKSHKVFAEQTIRPAGTPTLVPMADKREAIRNNEAAVTEMTINTADTANT